MMRGRFRDGHPRLTLRMRGQRGSVTVEYIVDTGFDGFLALPGRILNQLETEASGIRFWQRADGVEAACPAFSVSTESDEDEATVEALLLGGEPLLGTRFLQDQHLHAEMTEGGEIVVEPL